MTTVVRKGNSTRTHTSYFLLIRPKKKKKEDQNTFKKMSQTSGNQRFIIQQNLISNNIYKQSNIPIKIDTCWANDSLKKDMYIFSTKQKPVSKSEPVLEPVAFAILNMPTAKADLTARSDKPSVQYRTPNCKNKQKKKKTANWFIYYKTCFMNFRNINKVFG